MILVYYRTGNPFVAIGPHALTVGHNVPGAPFAGIGVVTGWTVALDSCSS